MVFSQNPVIDLTQVPDSLILVKDQKLYGDFNGDNVIDVSSIVKNKNNKKIGVLIIHDSQSFVFGAGNEAAHMADLKWIEIFKTIPKGEVVSPTS